MLFVTDLRWAGVIPVVLPLGYIVVVAIWRLYFHPMSRFPGPKLAALTNQYMAYQSWKGCLHLDMHQLHERYGDFVRYGPNKVLVNSTAAVSALYGSGAAVSKSSLYETMAHGAYNILTYRDKKLHAARRRTLSQGFSEQALRLYEDTIQAQISKFCTQVEMSIVRATQAFEKTTQAPEVWSRPMDMAEWSNYIFFDIMTNVVFGTDFGLIDSETHRHIPKAIEDSNVRLSVLLSDRKWKAGKIDKLVFSQSIRGRETFLKFVSTLIKRRIQEGGNSGKDVFSILSQVKDPETQEGLTPRQITAESVTLIVAGADTTSTAFAALLFYLSRYLDVYDRVAREVRQNFTGTTANSGNELNTCVLLRACIQEAMRMSPPVGGPMWREVTADNLVIDGKAIPKGCDIGTPAYALHHRPDLFPQPYEFIPERWMKRDEGVDDPVPQMWKSDTSAFIPFSVGSRGCIGRSLAMKEMLLLTATLLLRYDFRIAEGETGELGAGSPLFAKGRQCAREFQLYEHVTSKKDGPSLQFRRRSSNA